MFISINRKKIKYFEILLLVIFPTLTLKIIDSLLFWLNPFNTFIDSTYIYTFGLGLISLSLLVWDRESLKTKFEF